MVIDVVNLQSIPFDKAEYHSPVRANGNGPKAFQLPLEGMQPEPRQVHIRSRTGSIETRENVTQFFRVLADHASRVVVFVETFQSFVADRADQFPP
jgi:hypothetical protein